MKRTSRGVAELVYLVVYRHILFYIRIRGRDVGFGLIIVVIRHEKLHSGRRKELAELVAELCRKRLIVREHERGTIYALYDVRHRKRLAAARHALQDLRFQPVFYAFHKRVYRLRLVSRRLVFRFQIETVHYVILSLLRVNYNAYARFLSSK